MGEGSVAAARASVVAAGEVEVAAHAVAARSRSKEAEV
jgi:hypothetical protein